MVRLSGDVAAVRCDASEGGCCGGIEGQQEEGGGRGEQRGVWILPADGRRGRAGQEAADVEVGEVAEQQVLHEQQPGAQADERGYLVSREGADSDADGRPEGACGRAADQREDVVSRVEADRDAPRHERGGAGADGHGCGGEAEPRAGHHACPDLCGYDAEALRADEQRRANSAVADFAGDRHRAEQGGEQSADDLAGGEQLQLPGGALDVLGGQAEAVQEFGEQDEAEHRGEQAEVRPGRALLEKLGAQHGGHDACLAVSSRYTSSRVSPRPVSSSSRAAASSRPWSMIRTWSTVWATSASTWLETTTVPPRSANPRMNRRSQCIPAGSSPLAGSSRTSTPGSPSRAPARPSRCCIPSEYVLTRRSPAPVSPTSSSTSSTRAAGISAAMASARRWFRPERAG